MGISDLLTVLTIILAVYALLPKTKILDISLRLTYVDWFVIAFTGCVLFYLQFYSVFLAFNLTPKLGLSKYNLNTNNVSFLVVLILSGYLLVKTNLASVSAYKIRALKNLFEQLSYRDELGQMVGLLDEHFDKLVKLYTQDKFPKHKKLEQLSDAELFKRISAFKADSEIKKPKLLIWLRNKRQIIIAKFVKRQQIRRDIITDIFKLSLLNHRFVSELAKTNPYLAIKIMRLEIGMWNQREFCELYLKELFSSPKSILYFELNNNHNTALHNRYKLPDSNKLLRFLFADARNAEALWAWKPVGEQTCNFLIQLQRNPETDTYNLPYDNLYEEELRTACPLSNAIHFFDIMVTEAIYQNVHWHMWLHYFEYFTREIVKNYSLNNQHVDRDAEFPNRYSYLLYEIRCALCSWISTLNHLPPEQSNIQLENAKLDTNTGNIIHASILALGRCIYMVSSTPNITDSFKKYLIEGVFDLYFNLLLWEKVNHTYAHVLLNSVLNAGTSFYKLDENYNSLVLDTLLHIDTVPLVFENFEECLKQVTSHFTQHYGEHDSKYVLLKRLDASTLEVESRLLYQGRFQHKYKVKH